MGGVEMKTTGVKLIAGPPYKHKIKIHSISDERDMGQGFWIYLKGYTNVSMDSVEPLHTIHENSITECLKQLRCAEKCDCKYCIINNTKS